MDHAETTSTRNGEEMSTTDDAKIVDPTAPIPAVITQGEWDSMVEKITEIHAFVANFTAASAALSSNPMMKVMMRNFGIDPDAFLPGAPKAIDG